MQQWTKYETAMAMPQFLGAFFLMSAVRKGAIVRLM
jgi:hypothetical protein